VSLVRSPGTASLAGRAWNATSGTLVKSSVVSGPATRFWCGGRGRRDSVAVFGAMVKTNRGTDPAPRRPPNVTARGWDPVRPPGVRVEAGEAAGPAEGGAVRRAAGEAAAGEAGTAGEAGGGLDQRVAGRGRRLRPRTRRGGRCGRRAARLRLSRRPGHPARGH